MRIRKNIFILTVFMAPFILSNGMGLARNIVQVEQQKVIEMETDTDGDTPKEPESKSNEEKDSSISISDSLELNDENSSFDIQTKSMGKAVAIASGTWGTANWELDDAGVLHIYGGTFANSGMSPWKTYSSSINKIVFEDNVVAAQDSSLLFEGLDKLVAIENLNRLDTSNVIDMSNMFYGTISLADLDVSSFDTSNVTSMDGMFRQASSLKNLDVSNFDTSNVTSMYCMFYGTSGLTSLDLSSFDTNNVITMSYMFYRISSLTNLDVSSFDTGNVTNMYNMFAESISLTSLDVSSFDTNNVTNMSAMFGNLGSLTNLDVSHFDTSKVTNISYIFYGTSNLTNLDVSNFNTSNVTSMSAMFYGTSSLTNLDVSSFDTSNVTDMSAMFYGASSLTNLDVSSFDTSSVATMSAMFNRTNNLSRLSLGSNFNFMDGAGLPLITTEGYTGGWIGLTDHVIFNSSTDLMANFDGTQHADTYVWEREKKAINDFTVSKVANETYTGSAHTPVPTVSNGSIGLLMDVDYTLSYQNNVNAGTATIIITGIGAYGGTLETTFTINKATPVVNELPTASTLDRGETLGDSPLIGGSVTGVESLTNVEGTFAWTFPETRVSQTGEFNVIFTPTSSNYESIRLTVLVTITEESTPEGTATERTANVRILFKQEEDGGTIIDPTNPGTIIPSPENPNNGPLRMNYASNFNFGKTVVSGSDKVYYAELDSITTELGATKNVPNFVSVEDNRGTNEGWQLKVTQNGQLATDRDDELDGAELSFEGLTQLRDVTYKPNLASDQVLKINNAVNIADASVGNGSGSWSIAFGDTETGSKAVKLAVPGESKKVKEVQYKTTLTWDLGNTPL